MQVGTILNNVQPLKSFVYAHYPIPQNGIKLTLIYNRYRHAAKIAALESVFC